MKRLKKRTVIGVFIRILILVSVSSSSLQAWNAATDFSLKTIPLPWIYVSQSNSAFNGTYSFDNMTPYGGDMNTPSGWKASNSSQCRIWQKNGHLAMSSSQSIGVTAAQGFIKFTAPASGTYRLSGNVQMPAGVIGTHCKSWIRSDLAGTLWSREISQANTTPFDLSIDLKSGQMLIFGQDALIDSDNNNASALYWSIECRLQSKHSVSGLEKWDAYKDFCNTAQGHRNWRYLYAPDSKWSIGAGTDMITSTPDHDRWISANNPGDTNEISCGVKAENGRIILTGSSSALPIMRWNAPRNGYYRIHGDAFLESPGSAQLCVSMIDDDTPRVHLGVCF